VSQANKIMPKLPPKSTPDHSPEDFHIKGIEELLEEQDQDTQNLFKTALNLYVSNVLTLTDDEKLDRLKKKILETIK